VQENHCASARDLYSGIDGGQNMRVHFQQLTEPIAPYLDEDFEFVLIQFPQLKSPTSRSRRLPRACGDPA
jgi:hypothetical protein